jgi:hypothetical protein
LTNPRWNAPRWYHEGIAVFLETWMSGGKGRVLGSYDEMVFRSMVLDNAHFYDVIGLESEGTTVDFQVGVNSYLYGTRFMSFLALKYGPESLIEWTARNDTSKSYFLSQFKHIFNVPIDDAWSDWIAWEREWQTENIQKIKSAPVTPFRQISKIPLGSVSRTYFDQTRNKIYAAIRYPGQVAHVAEIDIHSGELRKICNVKGPALFYVTSLAWDKTSDRLFFTSDNYDWRDLNSVDIKTGEVQTMLKDVRIGDLAFNDQDQSLWGIRHYNGISTLVRIPPPYKEWNQIYSWPYGQDIFDLDISPDGEVITAAIAGSDGTYKLIEMPVSLEQEEEFSFKEIFDFENSAPANFNFNTQDSCIYGSSYYSGVSNIYRYNRQKEEMEIISNTETGFFRPLYYSSDSLIVFRYTGQGFIPGMIPLDKIEGVRAIQFLGNEIAERYPVVRKWTAKSPASVDLDSVFVKEGSYSPLGDLSLNTIYPVVEGYKNVVGYGLYSDFSDGIGLSSIELGVSYSPHSFLKESERLHLDLGFRYWNWELSGTYNRADFYDLFGPTKQSRRGYSFGIKFQETLIYDQPKILNISATVKRFGDLETLPDYQNVSASFDKLLYSNIQLDFENTKKSLGAVDTEKGTKWQLILHHNFVNDIGFPQIIFNYDGGILLPINHTSVWLRTSAGYSTSEKDDPFARFYFGGFGNNWVDHLSEKRYREYYTFPGLELNAIGARNYMKAVLELNLPPIRFRRLGFVYLYSNWIRTSLFSSVLRTNFVKQGLPETYFNLGTQIDFRIVLFSNLKSTFSLGYAVSARKDKWIDNEFMISLKIL